MSNGIAKKKDQKEEFFVVEAVRKVTEPYAEKLKDYREKYVKNPKETLKDYNEKYVKKYIETGKKYKEGLRKDALKAIDLAVEKGKKIIPENGFVEKAKDKINAGFKAVTDKINLPNREDIDRLTGAVEALNTKVDALRKN